MRRDISVLLLAGGPSLAIGLGGVAVLAAAGLAVANNNNSSGGGMDLSASANGATPMASSSSASSSSPEVCARTLLPLAVVSFPVRLLSGCRLAARRISFRIGTHMCCPLDVVTRSEAPRGRRSMQDPAVAAKQNAKEAAEWIKKWRQSQS